MMMGCSLGIVYNLINHKGPSISLHLNPNKCELHWPAMDHSSHPSLLASLMYLISMHLIHMEEVFGCLTWVVQLKQPHITYLSKDWLKKHYESSPKPSLICNAYSKQYHTVGNWNGATQQSLPTTSRGCCLATISKALMFSTNCPNAVRNIPLRMKN